MGISQSSSFSASADAHHSIPLPPGGWHHPCVLPEYLNRLCDLAFREHGWRYSGTLFFHGPARFALDFQPCRNLCHSSVWITYGPTWGKWFISPAHHQIHHSVDERHLGFNRGSDLAIWDRLYGTLYVPTGPRECFQYGLGASDNEAEHSIGKMLLAPFINLWRICGRRAKS